MAYSWVWRSGDVLCFDNIEITREFLDAQDSQEILFKTYKEASDELMRVTGNCEKRGIRLVVVGRNRIDAPNIYFQQLPRVNDYTRSLFKPNSSENLYLKDSQDVQVILNGKFDNDLKVENVEPIYLYSRKQVWRFKDCNKKLLNNMINSIYFDYCMEKNFKYEPLKGDLFVDGYLNEDWFVGIKADDSRSFYYCGNDKRLFKEAGKYVEVSNCESKVKEIMIVKDSQSQLNYLLDIRNYIIQYEQLRDYMENGSLEKYVFLVNEYLHGTSTLENFGKILFDKEITSAFYGKRLGYGVNNGQYYISLSKIDDVKKVRPFCYPAFVLEKNICAFPSGGIGNDFIKSSFCDSSYPVRGGHDYEWQVLNSISLDKAKAILVSNGINSLAQIVTMQEFVGNDLTIVNSDRQAILNKSEIKRYVKLK